MDESWRMRIGMPPNPGRRSVGNSPNTLETEDFGDVFGGPPKSVLLRKFSCDFTSSASFYDDIFRPPESVAPETKIGRSLPVFRIPARSDGFYSDIFGNDDDRRSRERSRPGSKGNSSSVLSSEDVSPLRPVLWDDGGLSSFAAKLRPINVPSRCNSSKTMQKEHSNSYGMPAFSSNNASFVDYQFMELEHKDNLKAYYHGFSRHVTSPETTNPEPNSSRSVKMWPDDLELTSPSSVVSSVCHHPEVGSDKQDQLEQKVVDDEISSSYVIEITSDQRDRNGDAVSIDEAIAWAKEKFQMQNSGKQNPGQQGKRHPAETDELANECEVLDQQIETHSAKQSLKGQTARNTEEEKQLSNEDVELELLKENIRLWSAGKERNICVLLSTLHHILWPTSGWDELPLTSLIENKQVKKAYQKARLCLHPDKVQQRGATVLQKCIAEKVFSILQDAWARFTSQDVLLNQQSI